MCALERSYPKVEKVSVGQILKQHLEYFSSFYKIKKKNVF